MLIILDLKNQLWHNWSNKKYKENKTFSFFYFTNNHLVCVEIIVKYYFAITFSTQY